MESTEGEAAVRIARAVAESETRGDMCNIQAPPSFSEHGGVFVTISEHPSGALRGCIGYPEPVFSIVDSLKMSASAACHDPRFDDLTFEETGKCIFEVTLLTVPEEIRYDDPDDLIGSIEIGQDGLIMEFKGSRGLLLPQVPVEWGWDAEEFLGHLSMKTGFAPDVWRHPDVRIKRFGGEIFSETCPYGDIVRR